ncbi:hypothetical protein MKW94_018078 [Papaver nudicaule]|uniref:Uncharacterized protein n=1 Tax=Papaver nudicaule TaxID=74823 RepID=A0AA41RLD1_PAPNU|nr:hypothetical protein [Papaver nudicaule]
MRIGGGTIPLLYLFGGLAAMLCLIAFAVLILGCSSCKMFLDYGDDKSKEEESVRVICKEQIGVIMAGDVKPTHLAIRTPCLIRNSAEKRVDFEDENPQEQQGNDVVRL